ncbi:hypothetical protein LTR50_000004 [Elasticomyces elasticus]|nr:hypothetical protein LTR50_000004 [Elasticomyces elasticus]
MGKVKENMQRADEIIEATRFSKLDLLVLPEMAFTGYNFPSLAAITPYLEPTASGPSTAWAIRTARRLHCTVTVGYPERTLTTPSRNYNATITISSSGDVIAAYHKSFLYYTDETWASEGHGFFVKPLPGLDRLGGLAGTGGEKLVAHGICMDINPYRFEAPWDAYEFAQHCVRGGAELVVLSMAWLTRLLPQEITVQPSQPDTETLSYWVQRFQPIIKGGRDEGVVVVCANRSGVEGSEFNGEQGRGIDGLGNDVVYAGSSCVLFIQKGAVQVFDMLGKAEEKLLVVDTSQPPKFGLQQGNVG